MPRSLYLEVAMDPLMQNLRGLRRRLWAQLWVHWLVTGLFAGLTAACVWLVATRLVPVLGDPLPVAAGLLVLGLVGGTIQALRRRPDLMATALAADRRLGLRERLSSSLALADADGPMIAALHRDARRHVEGLKVAEHFPWQITRSMRWIYAPILLFGLAYAFLPEFDLFGHDARSAQAKAKVEQVTLQAQRLEQAVKPLKESEDLARAKLEDLTSSIEKLAEELRAQEITEKQALARISDLSKELEKRMNALQDKEPMPAMMRALQRAEAETELGKSVQQGDFSKAAMEAKALKEKLASGELSDDEKEKVAADLKSLADKLEASDGELAKALAQALSDAAEGMEAGEVGSALEAFEALELSLEDLQSLMGQLRAMQGLQANLAEWQQGMLGPSEYCRLCGEKLGQCEGGEGCTGECGEGHACAGVCGSCGAGAGLGMGGPGRGQGNQVGELGNPNVGFQPTRLPGEMTKGKILAGIMQKALPDEGAQPTQEFVVKQFEQVQQEAEQALTKEEIPPAAREFVRQYFGTLEPAE
jgi:hypothetical protein